MYKPVRLDARDRVEQRLGGAERLGGSERRLGGSERRLGRAERLGGAGEAAELCGAAEILGVPLTQPDLIVRVFHAKMKEMLNDIHKKGIMGCTVARVWTIEFQKQGLPHMHMIIFFHPDSKLCTPEEVDSLLSTEFPDEET